MKKSLSIVLSIVVFTTAFFPLAEANELRKTVIQIEDIHGDPAVQAKISHMVTEFAREGKVGLLALEGAFEPLDFSLFQTFPHQESVLKAANTLLSNSKISGAVHAALTSPTPIAHVVGIEDERIYNDNVHAYRRSLRANGAMKEKWAREQETLRRKKQATYSPPLFAFDTVVQKYRKGEGTLPDYIAVLSAQQRVAGNLTCFVKAMALEKKIDPGSIERERQWLVIEVAASLDPLTLRTSPAAFYRHLCELARAKHLDTHRYEHVLVYAQYLSLTENLSVPNLLAEMNTAEKERYATLCQTSTERRLIQKDQDLYWLGKLMDFSLTKAEWKEYALRPADRKEWDIRPFERFYIEAEQRDHVLVRRLLNEMDKAGATTAVLVAGGFHSEGMAALLAEKGVTTIRCTPTVEKISASSENYLSFFAQKPSSLETMFSGRDLFLALPTYKRALLGAMSLSVLYYESLISRVRAAFAFDWFRRTITTSAGAAMVLFAFHQFTFIVGGRAGLQIVAPQFRGSLPFAVINLPAWPALSLFQWGTLGVVASVVASVITARQMWPKQPAAKPITMFNERGVKGLYFKPDLPIQEDTPFNPDIIKDRLAASRMEPQERVNAILAMAQEEKIDLLVTNHLRAQDGPGSANDFYEYFKKLTPKIFRKGMFKYPLEEMASTITVASSEDLTLRFSKNSSKTIKYVSHRADNGESLFKAKDLFDLKSPTPNGFKDAPGYIFQLFGITGSVKIEATHSSLAAEAGGMESSSIFIKSLIEGASMLSGANLSRADIWLLATTLENNIFGGKTGGQGPLAADLGGIQQHIFFAKDGVRAAFSRELIPPSEWTEFQQHVILVQAGVPLDDRAALSREAVGPLINAMWMHFLKMKIKSLDDPLAHYFGFDRLFALAHEYAQAVINHDYEEMIRTTNELVDIRNRICREWMYLFVLAKKGGPNWFMRIIYRLPLINRYAPDMKFAQFILGWVRQENPPLGQLFTFYTEEVVARTSIYSAPPINDVIQKGRKEGLGVMVNGAGGPGAILGLISARGFSDLEQFAYREGFEWDPKPTATDKFTKRRIPAGIGGGASYSGFDDTRLKKMHVQLPENPEEKYYDQETGEFVDELPPQVTPTVPLVGPPDMSRRKIVGGLMAFAATLWVGRSAVAQEKNNDRDALYNRSGLALIPPNIKEKDFQQIVEEVSRHAAPIFVVPENTWMHARLSGVKGQIVAVKSTNNVFSAASNGGVYEIQPNALKNVLRTSLKMSVQAIGWHIITPGDLSINIGDPRIDEWMNNGLFTIVSGGQSLLMGYAAFAQHELDLRLKAQQMVNQNA